MRPTIRAGIRRAFRLGIRRRDMIAGDMTDELRFHVDARVHQLTTHGWSIEAARAEALRRLGNDWITVDHRLHQSALHKEARMALHEWMDDIVHDVRHAARSLLQRRGFAVIAILTLAIGIGANTAIFSAIDAVLLRALPFAHPGQLMDISQESDVGGTMSWSWPKFTVFRDAQHSYQTLALHSAQAATFTGDNAERGVAEWVTAPYLGALAVHPIMGRDFPADQDAVAPSPRRALITAAVWQRRFHDAPDVIGKFVGVDGDEYEIIGVLPSWFRGLSGRADVLLPITSRSADALNQPWSLEFQAVGRLRAGVTPAQAAAEARLLGPRVYQAFPFTKDMLTTASHGSWTASAVPLDSQRVAPVIRRSLVILFVAVGLVLLITCVNLANLLLARAAARRQEIAVRLAIGGSRARLVRMLLAESMLLALAGGLAGIGIAWWGAHLLSSVNPDTTLAAQGFSASVGTNGFGTVRLDGRALLFTAVTTVVVGLLFGLLPALQATRPNVTADLKEGSAGSGRNRRTGGLRRGLVIAEIALSLVLLSGAGLMLRSLDNLLRVDPGFDGSHVLTMQLSAAPGTIADDSMSGFYDRVEASLGAIAGVRQVALADCPPLNGGCNGTIMTFPDRPQTVTGNAMVGVHWVSPAWFATMRVPLKRGRLFDASDRTGHPRAVLINQAAARAYFAGENPVGQRVKVYQGGFDAGATVVGVVGDVRFSTIDSAANPDVYIPYAQSHISRMMIFLRTAQSPSTVAGLARRTLHQLAPRDPVYDVETMADRIGTASAQTRFTATLLGLFAAIALGLAVMGIYGVIAFGVAQRSREIGVRMALGADRGDILGMVLREGLWLTAAGTLVGLGGAFMATRVLRTLLFGIEPGDPLTLVVIVACLGGATLLATWWPARRATRVNPVEVLRQ